MTGLEIAALIGAAGALYEGLASDTKGGTVQATSPYTAEQQSLISMLAQQAQKGLGKTQPQLHPQAQALMSGSPAPVSPQWSQAFSANVARPARQSFIRQTLPQIQRSYVGPGTYWGSERATAETRAQQELEDDLNARLLALLISGEQQSADRIMQLSALDLQNQQASSPLNMAQLALGRPQYEQFYQQPYTEEGAFTSLLPVIAQLLAGRYMGQANRKIS